MTKKRHEMHYLSLLSQTIRPSLIVIILSVILAIPSSWVTMITVFPDLLISLRSSNTSCPVFWSSAPVGSSVNCTPIPLCLENRGFNGMYICVLCTFSLYVKSKQIFSFQKSPLAFIY